MNACFIPIPKENVNPELKPHLSFKYLANVWIIAKIIEKISWQQTSFQGETIHMSSRHEV